jgi:rare lipoprotein A
MKHRFSQPIAQAVSWLALAALSACALPPGKIKPPALPSSGRRAVQTGIASWYGPGFHGQPTASGAVYDQNQLTAAHQTLPLGTRVLVTNLTNGRAVEVRINDRGPFAKGRIVDLSHAAADALDMIAPGTAPVRLEVIEARYNIESIRSSLDYTLQLGSFSQWENAQRLRQRLQESHVDVAVKPVQSGGLTYYRVQLGSFSDRSAAEQRAREVAVAGYSVIVMEKE